MTIMSRSGADAAALNVAWRERQRLCLPVVAFFDVPPRNAGRASLRRHRSQNLPNDLRMNLTIRG